jgi:hypothetical protein
MIYINDRTYHSILRKFLAFENSQVSMISSWSPVVETIVQGFSQFTDDAFQEQIPYFYIYFVQLLNCSTVQVSLQPIFERVGYLYRIPKPLETIPKPDLFPSLESLYDEVECIAMDLVQTSLRESIASLSESVESLSDPPINE